MGFRMRFWAWVSCLPMLVAGCADGPSQQVPEVTVPDQLVFRLGSLEVSIAPNSTSTIAVHIETNASWAMVYLPFVKSIEEYDIEYHLNSTTLDDSFWWCPFLVTRSGAGPTLFGTQPIVHRGEGSVSFEEQIVGFADGFSGLACLVASQAMAQWSIRIQTSAVEIDLTQVSLAEGAASMAFQGGLLAGPLVPALTTLTAPNTAGWTHVQFLEQGAGVSVRRYEVEYSDGVTQMGAGATSPGPIGLRALQPEYLGRTDNVGGTTSIEVEGVEGEGFTIALIHLASEQPFPPVFAGLYEQPS